MSRRATVKIPKADNPRRIAITTVRICKTMDVDPGFYFDFGKT